MFFSPSGSRTREVGNGGRGSRGEGGGGPREEEGFKEPQNTNSSCRLDPSRKQVQRGRKKVETLFVDYKLTWNAQPKSRVRGQNCRKGM